MVIISILNANIIIVLIINVSILNVNVIIIVLSEPRRSYLL